MSTWRSTIGAKATTSAPADDDDWETDPDFVVSVARAVVADFPYMVKSEKICMGENYFCVFVVV